MQDENCSSEAKNSKYQLVMSPENKMVDDAEFFLNVKFCLILSKWDVLRQLTFLISC